MPHVDLSQTPLSPREKLWQAVARECFGIEGDARSADVPDGKLKREIQRTVKALWDIESEPVEVVDAMQFWNEVRDYSCPPDARHIEEAIHQYRAHRKQVVMGNPHWWKGDD